LYVEKICFADSPDEGGKARGPFCRHNRVNLVLQAGLSRGVPRLHKPGKPHFGHGFTRKNFWGPFCRGSEAIASA
jgi:hypothetical protein